MITGFNKLIACEPIKSNTIEAEVKKGFATTKNKIELVKLKVLFGTDEGPNPGDSIYIMGDQVAHKWATTVFALDGVSFILVPLSAILLVDYE